MSTAPGELRLRQLSAASVSALSELFLARDVLVSGVPPSMWRFAPGRAAARSAIVLRGQVGEISVSLAEDALREPVGAREWWDYTGESLPLAWMLSHAWLLESLGAVLHDSFQPCGWSEVVPQTQPLGTICLEFSVHAEDDRATSGSLYIPAALVSVLARHIGWRQPSLALESWGDRLPAGLRIMLRTIAFPRDEVAGAEIGDVLILGRAGRCWHNLELTYHGGGANFRTWNASYDADRLTICANGRFECEETPMSRQAAETAGTEPPVNALESVPVTLDFEVGTVSVPLRDLAGLKPGYVFQLPGRLEEARVIIRANGRRIGSGELVAVDDVLGVQVLSIDPNGLL